MNWFKKTYNLLVQGYRDIRDFKEFRRIINKEINNPLSKYNKFELNRNKIGNIIYKNVDIPKDYLETEGFGSRDQYYFIMDMCRPIFNYFQHDLNFGEYMLTDVYHYEPVDADAKELILTYQIEFVFKPIALSRPLWWFYMVLIVSSLCGVGIWAYLALF